ncbi:MAG: response regulator transcription factor [Ardenticatenia bacterium]|nr:response regulator transcription factor [Ardenticatenia bacterium]
MTQVVQATILLIEDNPEIAEPLAFGLHQEGYRVLHAHTGEEGLHLARIHQPDLILLDIMLPGMDGFHVCRTLRAESSVPILMLTARSQELDRVMGLELGADDYIVKPFSFRELVARVRAMLRRRELDRTEWQADGTGEDEQARSSHQLHLHDLRLDMQARLVWKGEDQLALSGREFDLLAHLMSHAGEALHRQAILDAVWGEEWVGDPRTLDVHIHWLREKLGDDPAHPRYIQTVRGYGYRFLAPSQSQHVQEK